MPIRPELRPFYGAEWRAYRKELLALAGNLCQKCGQPHDMLNCAHVLHDPKNLALVAVWCPSCHATHDAPQRYAMTRRTRARRVGQLWLFPEVEWEPFAGWMIPRRVLEERQLRLEL